MSPPDREPRTQFIAEELVCLGREVIATVTADPEETFTVKGERMTNLAHVPVVHGLAQHSLRLGAVVLDLYERGLRLEAMPTARSLYECAITAQWAADSREGVSAIYNEEIRHRQKLARTMSQSVSDAFREFASTLNVDAETIDTVAKAQGRYFEARCLALEPVGHHGYALYRAMSTYCHPSASLVDHYVEAEDSPAGARLAQEPQQLEHSSWLFLSVASMVWATRAFDVMRSDHPHRSYLRGVAKSLGVPDVLRLTAAARQAETEAEQQRRRGGWKGPRPRSPDAGCGSRP